MTKTILEQMMDAIERIEATRGIVARVRLNPFGANLKRAVSKALGREATLDDIMAACSEHGVECDEEMP